MKRFLKGVATGVMIEIISVILILVLGTIGSETGWYGYDFTWIAFLPTPISFAVLQYTLLKKEQYDQANGIFWGTILFFALIFIPLIILSLLDPTAQMDF
jgi:predicted cobalt transporter CbtA